MDVVIPFRKGPRDSVELRYTLRSVEQNYMNLEEGECFLLGDEAPDWYAGGLVSNHEDHKLSNISKVITKLHLFTRHYTDRAFCFLNDDVFILRPWSGVRYWNKRRAQAGYHGVTVSRVKFLLEQRGHKFAHDYELHMPLEVETQKLKGLLDVTDYRMPIGWRTLYCNTYPATEFGIPDCKIATFVPPSGNQQFLSTDDAFLHLSALHEWWKNKWPKPSRWEK